MSETLQPCIQSSTADGVLELVIHNPARRNAIPPELRQELLEKIQGGIDDPDCRVMLLSGYGDHFSAGGDLGSMSALTAIQARRRLAQTHRLVRLLAACPKPIIAAVEGHAAGAGVSLAASCDLVVAARDATFTCGFSRIGLMPDMGAAWALPARMGIGHAKRLMLTGMPVNGEQALQLGLADYLVDAGAALSEARSIAKTICANAPLATAMTKAVLNRAPLSLEDTLQAEMDGQAILFTTADFSEGRAAFSERRPAKFRGE
jgi:enoyl-CoA hydratase/carnithine racemase